MILLNLRAYIIHVHHLPGSDSLLVIGSLGKDLTLVAWIFLGMV